MEVKQRSRALNRYIQIMVVMTPMTVYASVHISINSVALVYQRQNMTRILCNNV